MIAGSQQLSWLLLVGAAQWFAYSLHASASDWSVERSVPELGATLPDDYQEARFASLSGIQLPLLANDSATVLVFFSSDCRASAYNLRYARRILENVRMKRDV